MQDFAQVKSGGSHNEGSVVYRRVRKNIPVLQRSLAIVLASLTGIKIVIELKDDTEIIGTVDSAGHGMDVILSNAKTINCSGEVTETEAIFVKGSSIRYIHPPRNLGIPFHVSSYVSTLEKRTQKPKLSGKKRKATEEAESLKTM